MMCSRVGGGMQPHYVPNYYFNQIRRDTPPDLFQVKERRVNND